MPLTFREACCIIPECRRLVGREFCAPRGRGNRFPEFHFGPDERRRIEEERRRRGIQPF